MIRSRTALVLVAAALALAGCGDDRIPIVVYSPHGEDILRQFEGRFEAAHPEVDVRWFPMPPGDCLTRLRAEARNPRADVWWGGPSSTMALAAAEGLLEPYEAPWAIHVPADLRDAGGAFLGQFVLPQVIVYNRDLMREDEAPQDWDDLIAPAWNDRIILRYPMPSGGMRGAFASLIAWKDAVGGPGKGFAYLEALHRNTKRYVTDPAELFEAVKKDSDRVATIWNLTDALFQRDRYGYPFGIVMPRSGAPVVVDCIALVKRDDPDARRAALARAFYDSVNDLDALDLLMHDHWRIPTRTDVPRERKPDWLRDLEVHVLPVDRRAVEKNERAWMTYWEEKIRPLARE